MQNLAALYLPPSLGSIPAGLPVCPVQDGAFHLAMRPAGEQVQVLIADAGSLIQDQFEVPVSQIARLMRQGRIGAVDECGDETSVLRVHWVSRIWCELSVATARVQVAGHARMSEAWAMLTHARGE